MSYRLLPGPVYLAGKKYMSGMPEAEVGTALRRDFGLQDVDKKEETENGSRGR